jgi:hypothetical protein
MYFKLTDSRYMTIVLIFQIGNVKGAEETVKTAKALDIREESHIVQFTYRYCIRQGCGSESAWIRIKVKIWELQRLTMEAWKLKMEHWWACRLWRSRIRITLMRSMIWIRICMNVKIWIRIRFKVKLWIRMRIKVMRICKPLVVGISR